MKIIELVRDLKEKNINIESRDGELDIIVNENNLSDELLNRIKNNKRQLLDYLGNSSIKRSTSDFTYDGLKLREYNKILLDNKISDSNVDDIYNLTPLQEGLLFHSILDNNSLAYFEQISLDLEGDLDLSLFQEGWQQVVNLYDPLRTMFISDFRIPLQVVLKYRGFDFTFVDIREKNNKPMFLDEFKRSDRNKNFNLKNDPLFRLKLIQIEENQYTLILSFHHIILDGWCLPIIISRFMDNYSKLVKGEKASLGYNTKYSDYIYWLNNRDKETDLGYWKSFLEGYEDQTSVPQFGMVEYKGFEHQSTYSFSIDPVYTESLKKLADETCVTLNTMIQTIWGIVLSKYNGTDDVVFGSTVSGRPEEIDLIEEMVGLFINTIPVRIKAVRDKSFKQLALEVQRTALESIDYHYSSLADIQNESGLGNTLLDHILVFENYPIDKILQENNSSVLEIGNVESFEQINYNFGITVFPGESLDFRFCYNPEKYNKESLDRIASHIKNTVINILSNNDITVGEIDIIPAGEKNLLLNRFNDTKNDYPSDKTITQLFEEQVEKTPDNIAVVFQDMELSYRELNGKANIVANYLLDNYNFEPDDLVGVLLPRSEKMIIALLGILKSGGAYVPIDPEYPEDRIDHMLNDSNPKVVLCESDEFTTNRIEIIGIDKVLESNNSLKNPDIISKASNLAYVIYTSGSTGKPKGTLLEHSGLINMSLHQIKDFGIDETDIVLQFASGSFDASMYEIFMALFSGSSLAVIGEGIKRDVIGFQNYIVEKEVTIATLPPAYLENLDKDIIRNLRVLITAGEKPNPAIVDMYYRDLKYINAYGPTEASVCITSYCVDSELGCLSGIPIGKPISNTQIYILDKNNRLLPNGIPGEICVSGIGIARGYLNRPELTSEKFVENPFVTGERMYRTGDLARWLPDGNIDFLGRIDNQVKIRGFRIELGEIENSLHQFKDISSAIVIAKEEDNREKRLVAYYSCGKELEVSEIRSYLSKSLPDYMIPSYFIYIESFPITANGKIDIKALPEPDGTFHTGMEYVAPRNKTEEILAEIWQDILGVDKIGVYDNFFDLGGHSLKATRIVSRISKELEVEIALKNIFETPTIESIAINISQLSKKKYKQIEVIPFQKSYELSNAQKRLWILDQLKEEGLAYNMPGVFVLEGEFNKEAFSESYSYIINRHESLRTIFITVDGNPRQKILKEPDFSIEVFDLRNFLDKEAKAEEIIKNDLSIPFDLSTGPLLRIGLIRLEDNKYLTLFNMHHIVSDGWSMNIMTRDFLEAYNSLRKNQVPEFPPLSIHYKDYSAWHNNLLNSWEMNIQKEYWLDKLGGEIPVLNLPSDYTRPPVQTFKGDHFDFIIEKKVHSDLTDLCRKNKVSLFMLLQALLKILLHKHTGQEDIIVGTSIAGRVHKDLEDQIGFYLNTLALRDSVDPEMTFVELLHKVGTTCTEAFDNQDYPVDNIIGELDLKRDLSRSPLFDVLMILQNNDNTDIEFDGLTCSTYNIENPISKFDMSFIFSEADEGLQFEIEFNTDLYSEDRIKRMGEHLKEIAISVLNDSNSKIKNLDFISGVEKNRLLNVFNENKRINPSHKTVIDRFEEQVRTTPDNIAVVFGDVELSYKELNKKSNIVAHYLMDNYDVKSDDLIGILLDRSEKMIIALLGILKSGAAYVPVDIEYPEDRINCILEDSKPKVVICNQNDGIYIDINDILKACKNISNPEKISKPSNLAYIIYTSGSTGKPKGVLISNRNIVHYIDNFISKFQITEEDVVLQQASIAFDTSTEEIYPVLFKGGKIIVISKNDLLDLDKTINIINKDITYISISPLLLAEFNRMDRLDFSKLRLVISGGDELKANYFDSIADNVEIYNTYGPTESTVCITYYNCREHLKGNQIPIGSPIYNTNIYILDRNLNIVPQGVSGELCVSGIGVSDGYLNRPELTAEKFVENPFVPGMRMYRTGDLARWLDDGNIEFLGRVDNQVKIRGFRIELGEIESALSQYDSITSVVVLVKEGSAGDKQLIAYFSSENEPYITDIRFFLGNILPDYMIPSYFILMEAFPLTPNGKIDRKALPEPDGNIDTDVEYVTPRNGTEKKLVEIWEEILGNGKIGILDNFFELGGHSLKAMRIVSSISKDFEVEISLKDIFSNPTIESLSKIINLSAKKVFRPIEVISRQEYYEVSNSQKRLWVLDQLEEDSIAYNMPCVFSLEGEFNEEAFKKAYSYIINRHESLRTVFQTENGNPMQRILDNPDFNIEITDLRNIKDKNVKTEEIVGKNLSTPFDLSKGPLIRFALIRLEDEKYIILFNMHHIVSDGWSINILTRDFLASYNSFRKYQTPELEPLRIHYKDYTAWQNSFLESSVVESQRNYWFEKLSGELPVLDLTADRIRPSVQTFNGDHFGFTLPVEIQSGLNDLCRKNKVSLFMLLQALVKVLLHKYSGQKDIIVGSPIAGRVHQDLENQIGFYLNNLVLRDPVEAEGSFTGFLKNTAQTCSEAFENQNYPFDRIVEDLDLKRDLSRSPLFDILVILQNNETTELEFDGLAVLPYQIDNGAEASKFDITFDFTEISEGIHCILKYNTDIYSSDRMERMGGHFETLVTSVIENPGSKIKDLDIIPCDEKDQLLNLFNDTTADYPLDKTIVDLFEEQVEKTPDNVAVVFGDLELCYGELNRKANMVAHYLLDNHGVERSDFIAVLLERSEKMIIAILGILKTGAAYVPVDSEYPGIRIEYMLEDSDPKFIIGVRHEDNYLDINRILESGMSTNNPGCNIDAGTSCHLIYTSGTTGKPKGIVAKHENITNFIHWGSDYCFNDGIEGNFGLFTSISYDFTSTSIFLTLLRGKALVIFNQDSETQFLLKEVFESDTIDSTKLTPAHISLLDQLGIEDSGMKLVLTSGEELKDDHIGTLRGINKEIRIVNGYGTTELPTSCIVREIDDSDGKILIGKPIDNIKAFVMNNGMLSPIGIPGELCVSGSGVAKGYLNRPELTSEKFILNPLNPDKRMYRTGDLARWLPDGNIEFLGRKDHQIKIRGFRIEPGEIESQLVKYSGISSVVVVAIKGIDGDKLLTAYMVSENELDIPDLRDYLGKLLPDYMIPSFFVRMEELPLTTNGKVDRKALPEPEGNCTQGIEYVAPRNETEWKILEIWREVLGIEEIGINDNFFDLGGHSLKGTRIISRISKDLQVNISLKDIFENPTIESISIKIDSSSNTEYNQIEVIPEQNSYDISSAQRRLWVLDQFKDDSIAYNMPFSFILEGDFRIDAFKQAYSYMIKRHESLRTIFTTINDEPRQIILKSSEYDIKLIDLRDFVDKEEKAQEITKMDLLSPFEIAMGPLIRFTIITIENDKYILLFNMHHIISDGWSIDIFIKEFIGCYKSFKMGISPTLKALRIQYKDYSAWQNKLLNSTEIKSQKKYWLKKMSGEIPVMEIPSDKFRPIVQTFNGKSKSFNFSKEINSSINDLCRKCNISLFMMLQAMVKVLFFRYTGQNDIIIGSPVAGRVHKDLENQIGFYVNTLVFKDNITSNLSFVDFLKEIRRTCTEAFDNQDYPFDRLVEDLDIKRDLSRSPLFDILLVLQNNESSSIEFDGLEFSPYKNDSIVSKYDMTFNFTESEGKLLCQIEFNTDIYTVDRITRMVDHLKTLVLSILESPESKIEDLEIIPVGEKNLLLDTFNDTKTDYTMDKTIIDLFEEQVEKTPDEVAIFFENIELTYKELNVKVNIVANYLKDNYKIKPDDLIGLLIERSGKMIISLLGILKSGAAFVPIEPDYPENRINFIIEDSNPVVVLGEGEDTFSNNIALVDINEILKSERGTENPVNNTSPENLVYAIYTSGSTGNPKGVLLEQKTLINLVDFEINQTNLEFRKKKVLQFAALSFDVCYQEIFSTVLNGGTLYIVGNKIKKRPELLLNYMNKCEINVAFLPTAYLKFISKETEYLSLFPVTLEHIIAAGEQLLITDDLIYELKQKRIFLHNHYGPSETHVVTTLTLDFNENIEMVPTIGKPVSNTGIYIVDENNCISPLGIKGELCISGVPLAREYLNNLELTNSKFVENPFIPGEKMYRTGDLARWLPCGNIEFLGRIDNQVKIRGFRIELEEIESSILKHENINSAVVLAKKRIDGETQIVAYFVSNIVQEISKLRDYIGQMLPDFMIPSYFIPMKVFPLTNNGKVDIKSLPEPDGNFSTGIEYIPPRNKIEEKLASIWEKILRIEKIGINDNFFELGGHSLKATRVVSWVFKDFEVNISLKDIFENPTIESLSGVINKTGRKEYAPIIPVEKKDSYELSSAQKRLWLLDQLEENSIVYNLPVGLYLEGEFSKEAFQKAQTYIIQRHESLRTIFIIEDGEPRQKILKISDSEIQIVDLRDISNKKVEEEVGGELVTSFNLEKGPLIRFTLFRIKDDKYLLLFNMHHIISDGWSMNILTREFLDAYNSFRIDIAPNKPELKIQYKDYSAWLNNLLDSSIMDNQRDYWLNKLGGELPVLDLPADRIRPSLQSFNGNNLEFTLSGEAFSGLGKLCRKNNVSLFMMIQTLVKVLIYRYTGQSDIILGSPVAGRIHEDLENQIGFFINTLAFRDTVKDNVRFDEFLHSVKKTCIEAFDNQVFPFDTLVEELNIERDLSRSPVFNVMLVLQNNETTDIEFDGLKVSTYETKGQVSKFDITFSFTETENVLACGIEYNTDIYNEDRITRMISHLKILISSVISNPEVQIGDIEIIPEEEKNLLLNMFNDTKDDYPLDKTIIDLFEDQVEKTPDNIAVVFEGTELSYRELNRKANTLGYYLRDNYKIKPDDFVGVLLERSEKLIIAILGILKSGAAYVPIDPEYPEERIDYILKDSKPRTVISDKNGKFLIDINKILEIDGENGNPERKTDPENLAYLIYTSGSTGKPKGVMLSIRNVINFFNAFYNSFNSKITSLDNCLSTVNISFDVSVCEIFASVLSGAKLFIYKDSSIDIKEYCLYLEKNEITLAYIHPGILKDVADNINREKVVLNKLLVGVEGIKDTVLNEYINLNENIQILNGYGPTEATICSTFFDYSSKTYTGKNVSIGSPLSNTQIFILDKNQKLVPIGVPGEICISGVGLSHGYLDKGELTEEKFISCPFNTNDRMYRSGDLARWLPDGNLEFIGRIDNQVKIRGFRIEPGEIENVLLKYDGIRSAFVLVKKDFKGEKHLVAYYVSDKVQNISDIKNFMGISLPYYMIPFHFVFLKTIPFTENGKINTKVLVNPLIDEVFKGLEYVAPENGIQEILVEIWLEILGVDRIGIDNNFFELGGHSLKATILIAKINKKLKIQISLSEVFQNPTIRGLNKIIEKLPEYSSSDISKAEEKEYYPLSSVQKRMYFLQQLQKDNLSYNIPRHFILSGIPDMKRVRNTIKTLIKRHESFRTSFEMVDNEIYQKIHNEASIEIEEFYCSNECITQAMEDFFNFSFDLGKAPLLRAGVIIDTKNDKWILLFNLHHIITDGISDNLFIDDFIKIYNGQELSDLRFQYKDYSEWHNSKIQQRYRKHQEKFWIEKFSGNLPLLNLPIDFDRPKVKSNRGGKFRFFIDNDELQSIKGIIQIENVTLFIFLLSIFNILLSKLSGQDTIIVGTSIAGRRHADLEKIIGMFISNHAFINFPRQNLRFSDFLRDVGKSTIETFDNQDYLLEDLLEKLNLKRIPGRNPLFDVMFVLNNETSHSNDNFQDIENNIKILDSGSFDNSSSQMDLKLRGIEIENQINFIFEYSSDLFNHETVEMFANYYKDIVSKVISNKEIMLKDISVNHGILSTSSKIVADDGDDFNF